MHELDAMSNPPNYYNKFRKLATSNEIRPSKKNQLFRYGPEVDGLQTRQHNDAEFGHPPSPRISLRKFVRSLIPLSRNPPESYVHTIPRELSNHGEKKLPQILVLNGRCSALLIDMFPSRLLPALNALGGIDGDILGVGGDDKSSPKSVTVQTPNCGTSRRQSQNFTSDLCPKCKARSERAQLTNIHRKCGMSHQRFTSNQRLSEVAAVDE
ncbi:hypothetical protein F5882DRAFT_481026 [Hyaloscypha sp. PMI_1271]|nr:hypothetical protein F5882DRAFT_481026 [Hyaloscypha sp. PMI_1271]